MKTVVIYKSKAGFTLKYAQWISEKLSVEMFDISKISIKKLQEYDTIIFGGGIYGMKISGINFLEKHIEKLKGKKIYLFAVGGSPVEAMDLKKLKADNLHVEGLKKVKLFYFRGGFDFTKLSFYYRIIMSYYKFRLKRKKQLTPDEKVMLKAYEAPMDFTSRKETKALTRLIKNY